MARGPSEAARVLAYQTRARMGATLWFRVAAGILLAWVAVTLGAVWYETGQYFPQLQHLHFWQWVLCNLALEVPILRVAAAHLSLPIDGAWYRIPALADWLNGNQFYYVSVGAWFRHYAPYTAVFPITLGALVLVWRAGRSTDAEHIRGLKLLSPKQHNRQLHGGFYQMFRQDNGIRLGETIIPREKECEHFLVTGSPGSGKSTLKRNILLQVQERRQIAIVVDPDCEFVQEFFHPDRGDVVLNPMDARCPFWSPWLEFRDVSFAMDAEAMAASLIRGTQARNATEEFFRESGRTLLESIFSVVDIKDRSDPRGLIQFLSQPRLAIHEKLRGTRAYPLVDPGAHEQGSGILATAANAVKSFYHLPTREQAARTWSAREWAANRPGWIFLSCTEDARAAVQALQGVWLDSLVRWLMAAEIQTQDKIWIVADELPALGYQAQIEKLVTRGRKRGLAVVLGFQNISQLRAIYGTDGAITLSSCPTTKAILRCDEAATAKWASDLLGSREVFRTEMSQSAGLSVYRDGVNLQERRASEDIVTAAEIQLLKPLEGYLAIAGHDRTTLKIPPRFLQKNQAAFLPRAHSVVPAGASPASESTWSA